MKDRKNKAVRKMPKTGPKKSLLRVDTIEAREIHLLSGEGAECRSRLSVTLDDKGYPMIRMGDFDGPTNGVRKMIEVGFEVSKQEHWPYVKLSVGRDSWECSTMSVVDRSKNGKQETYPESSMHRRGNIRTYYAVDPSNGVASLELWGTEGKRYTITGNGPKDQHLLADDRCICPNTKVCGPASRPKNGKKARK